MMKLSTVTMLACGVALTGVLSVQVLAQGPGGGMGMGAPGMGPGGVGRGGGMLFEMYDDDGDGKITKQEFDAGHAQKFETLDANGNGKITIDELNTRSRRRGGERIQQAFKQADSNHDGGLDKNEYETTIETRFESVDVNKDGAVTREEVEAIAVQRRGAMGQQRGQ